MRAIAMVVGVLACGLGVGSARGATVYSNDFEANAAGFSHTTRASYPNVGSLATNSMFLGPFGNNAVTLSLDGLIGGREYSLAFDLNIRGPWSGNSTATGLDQWSLTVGGTTVINTTFSNTKIGDISTAGSIRTQNYSDATPNGPTAHAAFTGADVVRDTTGANSDFAIYYFGHGAGNPMITFIPTAASVDIVFAGSARLSPSSDHWALDNVRVETEDVPVEVVPLPGAAGAGMALLAMLGWRRGRRRGVE